MFRLCLAVFREIARIGVERPEALLRFAYLLLNILNTRML